MLPSEVIVETVEVALSRPTLVVRFDNALLFTLPVIGYDAAVSVPFAEKVWCAVLFLCPLYNNGSPDKTQGEVSLILQKIYTFVP